MARGTPLRTGCPRDRDVTRESFGSVSAACSVCFRPPEKGGEENGAASPDVPSAPVCLTFAAFWIVAAEAAAAASAFEASARVRFRVPKVPPPAPHTCQQACASVWSMPNQGLSRLNPGTAQLHAGSREHPCANKHSVAESFPHTSKNMHVWQRTRGRSEPDRRRKFRIIENGRD